MKIMLKCPLCKVRWTTRRRCWKCERIAAELPKQRTAKPAKRQASPAKKASHERASNQESEVDKRAKALNREPVIEPMPCRRCGRLVLVQQIPEEERRKLRTLPEAVECEKPCEARVTA